MHVLRAAGRPSTLAFLLPLALAFVMGCSNQQTAPMTEGLALLSAAGGPPTLARFDAAASPRPLTAPDPGIAWLAVAPDGAGVAALDDGSLRSSPRALDPHPQWQAVTPTDVEGSAIAGPFLFATWDPGGVRFATIAAAPPGGHARLVINAPATSGTLPLPIVQPVVPVPPVWLDGDRVGVVVQPPGADPRLEVIDTRTGDVSDGPPSPMVATGGSKVAVASADRTSIDIRSTGSWLRGATATDATITPHAAINQFALDAAGARLAVVLEGSAGTVTDVVVYAAASQWRETARIAVPGDDPRAEVLWLP